MASISKDKGRWRVQIRRKGFKISENFDTKKDAEAWARAKEAEVKAAAKGLLKEPIKGMEVQDIITAYVENVGPKKDWGRSKDYVLERLKNDRMIGHVRLSDFTRLHVSQFVDVREKQAQGSTIAADLDFLGVVFKWARDIKFWNVDPELIYAERRSFDTRGISPKSKKRKRIASQEELERLSGYFAKNLRVRIPMSEIICFASISTLRQDEVCKLRVEDIDFKRLVMLVKDRKHPEEKLHNDSLVPILKPMYEILKQAVGDRKSGPAFTWTIKKTGEIRACYADSVRANFDRACKALEIEDLHFHDLRHTAITNLFAIGLQIQEVAVFSGHKDWSSLKRYTHVSALDVQRTITRLQFFEHHVAQQSKQRSDKVNEVPTTAPSNLFGTTPGSSWAWFGGNFLMSDASSNPGQELLQ